MHFLYDSITREMRSMKRLWLIALLVTLMQGVLAQDNTANKKVLVAYFSVTGTTAKVAKLVAEATDGVLFQIEPEKEYTSADLDWRNKQSRSSIEMSDRSSRPALKTKVENLGEYDIIYLGFPIWWDTTPTLINTFIEAHDFGDKLVVPFATSGSSSIKNACANLRATYPKIKWGEGKLLNRAKKSDIQKWVNAIK